jgi:hypothetical protein
MSSQFKVNSDNILGVEINVQIRDKNGSCAGAIMTDLLRICTFISTPKMLSEFTLN